MRTIDKQPTKESSTMSIDPLDMAISSDGTSAKTIAGGHNENYQDLIKSELGVMKRMFKGKLTRAVIDGQTELAKTEIDFRIRGSRIVREAQSQALAEAANAYLEVGKTASRKHLGEKFLEQKTEFENSILNFEKEFEAVVDRADEQISGTKNSRLKEFKEQELERKMRDFYNTLLRLSERFNSIIDEGIDSLSGQPKMLKSPPKSWVE